MDRGLPRTRARGRGPTLDARRILNQLESRRWQQYVSWFGTALIHDALGEKEPALAAIDRAHEDHALEFSRMDQLDRPDESIGVGVRVGRALGDHYHAHARVPEPTPDVMAPFSDPDRIGDARASDAKNKQKWHKLPVAQSQRNWLEGYAELAAYS